MYYIYHIPGKKIGCAEHPKERVNKQGFIDYEILETHSDIYTASNREQELQKQYGYKVDTVQYHMSRTQWGKKAGIIGGKSAVDSGQLKAARKLAHQKCNHSKYKCPHCDKEGQYRVMKRWHGDNCKSK